MSNEVQHKNTAFWPRLPSPPPGSAEDSLLFFLWSRFLFFTSSKPAGGCWGEITGFPCNNGPWSPFTRAAHNRRWSVSDTFSPTGNTVWLRWAAGTWVEPAGRGWSAGFALIQHYIIHHKQLHLSSVHQCSSFKRWRQWPALFTRGLKKASY